MSETLDPPTPLPPAHRSQPMSVPALTLGLISLVAWLIPIIGIPLSVVALVLGICSLARHGYSGKATAAIVLATISLLLGVVNSWVGAQMGAQMGQRMGMCAAGYSAYCDRY